MNKVDFEKVVFNPAFRASEINRYSGVYLSKPESLSDHIYYVMMLSTTIASSMKARGENIDVGLLLQKCLWHDIDETITGDIPRNTKYATPGVHKEMEVVAQNSARIISEYFPELDVYKIWETAKDGPEGTILKIADMLCVVSKAMQEVELYGNKSCLKVVCELSDHLTYLEESQVLSTNFKSAKAYVWLNDLIRSARDKVEELRENNKDVIIRYNIMENVLKATDYHKDKETK